jgi:hypothetical protein
MTYEGGVGVESRSSFWQIEYFWGFNIFFHKFFFYFYILFYFIFKFENFNIPENNIN